MIYGSSFISNALARQTKVNLPKDRNLYVLILTPLIKGTDRLCKVVKLSMQYCGQIL